MSIVTSPSSLVTLQISIIASLIQITAAEKNGFGTSQIRIGLKHCENFQDRIGSSVKLTSRNLRPYRSNSRRIDIRISKVICSVSYSICLELRKLPLSKRAFDPIQRCLCLLFSGWLVCMWQARENFKSGHSTQDFWKKLIAFAFHVSPLRT